MKYSNPLPVHTAISIHQIKEVIMTQSKGMPTLNPEIVAPPSVSNLSVAQVGTGMFSVTMQVIMVVRFPTDLPTDLPVAATSGHITQLQYGNSELPNAFDGEAEGFQAFAQVHGYVPATRDILVQWATHSQVGA
jgi:hypothetical protein